MASNDSTIEDVAAGLGVRKTPWFSIKFYATSLIRFVLERLMWACPHPAGRTWLARRFGVRIGTDGFLGVQVLFDRSFPHEIIIGDHVVIADRCMFFAHSNINRPGNDLKKIYPIKVGRITVEDHVTILPGCIILANVTIGHHSILSPGSIISQNVPPNSVVIPKPPVILPNMRMAGADAQSRTALSGGPFDSTSS